MNFLSCNSPRKRWICSIILALVLLALSACVLVKRISVATIKPYRLIVRNGFCIPDYETANRRFYEVYYWGSVCKVVLVGRNGEYQYELSKSKDSANEYENLPPSG